MTTDKFGIASAGNTAVRSTSALMKELGAHDCSLCVRVDEQAWGEGYTD